MDLEKLKFIELKTGYEGNGPAWIGIVKKSKSGQTIYFNDKALIKVNGTIGNFLDTETGEEYWVSTPKKKGNDRHKFGSGPIIIQKSAVEVYLAYRKLHSLPKEFVVQHIPDTSIEKFHHILNTRFK